jgi:transcriptional antiterminator NusG
LLLAWELGCNASAVAKHRKTQLQDKNMTNELEETALEKAEAADTTANAAGQPSPPETDAKAQGDLLGEEVPVEEDVLLAAQETLAEAVTLETTPTLADEESPSGEELPSAPAEPVSDEMSEAMPLATQEGLVEEDILLAAEEPLSETVAPDVAPAQAEADAEGDAQAEEAESEEPDTDDGRAWYVLHSYSGYENKVKINLEHRIASMNMQDRIFQVVVPTEEEIEIREGSRRKTKKRVFPGYILVQMILDEDSWYVVRNTPGVTGFVSSGSKPTPLRPEEVSKIFKRMEREAPKIKVGFREGQTVRIVDGPFADFVGVVDELNLEKGRVRVLVSFFGRETPIELDFLQVQR